MLTQRKGLNQETLKLIACVSMLIDHVGAVLLPDWIVLRGIGRIAFPIYCFLLAEGAHYTHDPKKYGLRLLVGALLSEIPFDLAIFGAVNWNHQNVMVTLLLGFLMAMCMKRVDGFWKLAVMIPFVLAADWMRTDYGAMGVAMIGLFVLTRGVRFGLLWQLLGMACLCWDSLWIHIGGFAIPIEMIALLALIPIGLYSGRKATRSRVLQGAFYLFYPVHLLILWWIGRMM